MAEKIAVTVEVSKELHELLTGLRTFVKAVWPALKDGVQATDVLTLVNGVMGLLPALKGVEGLPAEFTLEPAESAMAGAVFVSSLLKDIKGS